jgi:hypothetical protein
MSPFIATANAGAQLMTSGHSSPPIKIPAGTRIMVIEEFDNLAHVSVQLGSEETDGVMSRADYTPLPRQPGVPNSG